MNTNSNESPVFKTERFTVAPRTPSEARILTETLLQDDVLAAQVPWLADKSRDGISHEACRIESEAFAGKLKVWAIVARELQLPIGAIFARNSIDGIAVEVLVASLFWNEDVVDEACDPVTEWLEETSEVMQDPPPSVH